MVTENGIWAQNMHGPVQRPVEVAHGAALGTCPQTSGDASDGRWAYTRPVKVTDDLMRGRMLEIRAPFDYAERDVSDG